MYNALIVDDDILVRMDLRAIVDWENLNIKLIEEAKNGIEALDRIREFNPDIIVLDLEMPLLNGIEVIKKLGEVKYDGKIIVLSCHDDFDSVSEALKMGASDYILKHNLTKEILIKTIEKILRALEEKNVESNEKNRIKILSELSIQALKENFIKELAFGILKDRNKILDISQKIGISLSFDKYIMALVEVDDLYKLREKYTKAELSHLLKSMSDILDTTLNGNDCISALIAEGEYCIIINFEQTKSFMNINSKTYEICERILENIKKYLNLQVSIGLSRICGDALAIDECYTQSKLALEGKFYLGKNRVIHFSELENYNEKLENFLIEYENDIIKTVITDYNKINKCINTVFLALKSRYIKPEYMRILCFELLMLSNKITKEYKLTYMDVYGSNYLPYSYVMELETLDDIEGWFVSVCHSIHSTFTDRIQYVKNNELRPEIKKALEYIEKNYIKDLSLQEVADYSNLSRTYFSQIFSHEMKESFSDYLCRYRIEKAKYLLKNTNLKIYEVGVACGIQHYRYFTKLFKDISGVSPGEYKTGKIITK